MPIKKADQHSLMPLQNKKIRFSAFLILPVDPCFSSQQDDTMRSDILFVLGHIEQMTNDVCFFSIKVGKLAMHSPITEIDYLGLHPKRCVFVGRFYI